MLLGLIIGLLAGLAAAAPLVVWAARRTERRMRELTERAQAAERLAHIGTLTGGLAHEIKNPLSSINLNLQLLQEDMADLATDVAGEQAMVDKVGRVSRRLDSLARESNRLRDILEDFLRFAGRLKLDREPTNVNELVDELTDFFLPQAQASGVTLRTQLGEGLPDVSADASLLKQAVLNLLINGCQAMADARDKKEPTGGGGDLLIRTAIARSPTGPRVRVHVADTGPGISPENVQRIFEPYYSTKKGGTGLGLPTARRIIEEHGGTLGVHSETGRGTEFVVSLPVAERSDVAAP